MIILHTTGCPKCKVLKTKLENANIVYETNTDTSIMIEKGWDTVPMLEVDGIAIDYSSAIK